MAAEAVSGGDGCIICAGEPGSVHPHEARTVLFGCGDSCVVCAGDYNELAQRCGDGVNEKKRGLLVVSVSLVSFMMLFCDGEPGGVHELSAAGGGDGVGEVVLQIGVLGAHARNCVEWLKE